MTHLFGLSISMCMIAYQIQILTLQHHPTMEAVAVMIVQSHQVVAEARAAEEVVVAVAVALP